MRFIRGFTLVEILIALAILAMVVASTFTIFRSSSSSWQKGESRSERYHNARVAIGSMGKEISHAILNENPLCNFIGEKEDIKFISYISTQGGVFEIAEIEYWLDKGQSFLMRSQDLDPDYDFVTQDTTDILAENISSLEFSYYNGHDWTESWTTVLEEEESESGEEEGDTEVKERVLPKAIKIKITVEGDKPGESEIFEIVTHLKMV